MTRPLDAPDPNLDLVLERDIDVPPALVWRAWTEPEMLKEWFAPKPWSIVECDLDLRPGGIFRSVMRSPEGQDFPNVGCFLEIVPQERLVWTDTLGPGYRPKADPFFTAIVTIAPTAGGTRYVARAVHGSEATRQKHKEMGFHEGWGQVAEQMVAFIKTM
jgi:uncharacterized protein YndB with AHSA1/START domain